MWHSSTAGRRHAEDESHSPGDDSASGQHSSPTAEPGRPRRGRPRGGAASSAAARRKRSAAKDSDDEELPGDDEDSLEMVKPQFNSKRTYYRRKEEKELLTKELERLNRRLGTVQRRSKASHHLQDLSRRQNANRMLHEVVRGQRLTFATSASMMGHFLQAQHEYCPLATPIKLSRDPFERRQALLALKDQKLKDAVDFLTARSQSLDMSRLFRDHQRVERTNGDYISTQFDVIPFFGLHGVKQVFDALLHFVLHMEMSVSETLGDITVREDDEYWDGSISQHFLVTSVCQGVHVETNAVIFTEFDTPDAGEGVERGIIALDFVDEDERYPYHPSERVRQDATVVMMVSSYTRQKPRCATDEREAFVGVTRWAQLKHHYLDSVDIPTEIIDRMRDGIEHVGDAMIRTVNKALVVAPRPGFANGGGTFSNSDRPGL